MKSYDWTISFRQLYDKAMRLYGEGRRDGRAFFTEQESDWLASIGCRPMELYDFAEDYPEVDRDTALLITAARRDYFFHVMKGRADEKILAGADFPPKNEELDGIRWLPRIILKAKAKLRGGMPDSLMYCCGGDRAFLKKFDIHPADFLRLVWAAEGDDRRVVEFVKSRSGDA